MTKHLVFILFLLSTTIVTSQKKYDIRTIAFYNLENLFDTINDVTKKDELSPIMEITNNRSKVYWDKIDKLSEIILKIGHEKSNNSPVILGVAEVENEKVLHDLVNSPKLIQKPYNYLHINSPDGRGIDVGFLYQPRYFKPIHYEAFNPNIFRDNQKINTRDILWVQGFLDNEKVNFIVNHWPSRRGGEAKSSPLREKAAFKVTQIIEQIRENDENAKIIIMGDFNDDPINKSIKQVLKTKANKEYLQQNDIYNPYENMFKQGFSTLGYRDNINLFDQILITHSLVNLNKNTLNTYKMFKAGVFNKRFLTQKKGRYKGYPFRSFSNGTYTGGYSDHYPVYIYVIKEQ